jgi:hypothetical protein
MQQFHLCTGALSQIPYCRISEVLISRRGTIQNDLKCMLTLLTGVSLVDAGKMRCFFCFFCALFFLCFIYLFFCALFFFSFCLIENFLAVGIFDSRVGRRKKQEIV